MLCESICQSPLLRYIHPEHWSWCKVGERPTAFLMDTPGVMLPNVPNEQTGMRLSLTGMASINHALIRHCPIDYVQLILYLYFCLCITGFY